MKNQYRPNVAMVIIKNGRLLLLERIHSSDQWQVPQGGVDRGEDLEEAMWRELKEETGILPHMAAIRGRTKQHLSYTIPPKYRRNGGCKGQRQHWFLLELRADDKNIHFRNMQKPEFSRWRWSSYWSAIHHSIDFKKQVYRQALLELLPYALKLKV